MLFAMGGQSRARIGSVRCDLWTKPSIASRSTRNGRVTLHERLVLMLSSSHFASKRVLLRCSTWDLSSRMLFADFID